MEWMYRNKLGKTYYSFDHCGWHFLVLDSIGRTADRSYFGEVDAEQMSWIVEDLKNIQPDTPIVVTAHMPFFSVIRQFREGSTVANTEGWVITNAREVLKLFDGYDLKLVLQGHLHSLEEIEVGGITFLTGGAVSAAWWLVGVPNHL